MLLVKPMPIADWLSLLEWFLTDEFSFSKCPWLLLLISGDKHSEDIQL